MKSAFKTVRVFCVVFVCAFMPLMGRCADSTARIDPEKPTLIFHVSFDGRIEADRALGEKKPCKSVGLSFAEGLRGRAVRMSAQAGSLLAYAASKNLPESAGTISLWFKPLSPTAVLDGEFPRCLFPSCPVTWSGSPPLMDWNHLAVTWDARGVCLYLNGKPPEEAASAPLPWAGGWPLDSGGASSSAAFFVGGTMSGPCFEGLLDEFQIYSGVLSSEQIHELWRRDTVIELKAVGRFALADRPNRLLVSATSPGGCDLSQVRYCLCDKEGNVVMTYRQAVTSKPTELVVNLPAGDYDLCTTDGTWFYGRLPYVVLRRENPFAPAREEADPRAKGQTPEAFRGITRLWRDAHSFDRENLRKRQAREARAHVDDGWSRIVARMQEDAALTWGATNDNLVTSIDRMAARMLTARETLLACPAAWNRSRDLLSAWYAKFDDAGLFVMPWVRVGEGNLKTAKARRQFSNSLNRLVEQGRRHPSFKGICLWLLDEPLGANASFFVDAARKLAESRPDLRLWIIPPKAGFERTGLDLAQLRRDVKNILMGDVADIRTESASDADDVQKEKMK